MTASPSWLFYSTLRSVCILHNIEVQNVSRRTLFNWRNSGNIQSDVIDILVFRLVTTGILSYDSIVDIAGSCGFTQRLSSFNIFSSVSLVPAQEDY